MSIEEARRCREAFYLPDGGTNVEALQQRAHGWYSGCDNLAFSDQDFLSLAIVGAILCAILLARWATK